MIHVMGWLGTAWVLAASESLPAQRREQELVSCAVHMCSSGNNSTGSATRLWLHQPELKLHLLHALAPSQRELLCIEGRFF